MKALFNKISLKLAILTLVLFFGIIFAGSVGAQEDIGWTIESFNSLILVGEDTTVSVTETIIADFGGLTKHGIYRDIPVSYRTRFGNNLNIRLTSINVTDSKGKELETKITREGDNMSIRIGDPDVLVSGRNTYIISYKVSHVITTPKDDAELYWNATGNDWPVPILSSSVEVSVPKEALVDAKCFTGTVGSSAENCEVSKDKSSSFFSTKDIFPGEGFTVAVAINKNSLSFPSFFEKLVSFLVDNLLYFLPLLTLAVMFRLYLLKGRDKEFKNLFKEEEGSKNSPFFEKLNSISVSVNPPADLSPGEVGTLIDEHANINDITATVIDLARRGFLTVTEEEKKGIFKKASFVLDYVKKDEGELKPYELSVLDMLFTKKRNVPAVLTKLHPGAYQSLQEAQKNLYEDLSSREYFLGRPDDIRNKYLIAGIFLIFGAIFLGGFVASLLSSPGSFYFAMITSGIIIVAFSFFMPARSAKGRKALMDIVGFKEVLRLGAWREKIYEKHNFFEEVLPYAIAFGITDKFIKAFKNAEIKDVSWYKGSHPLNILYFNSSMNSFGSSLNQGIAASRPSASAGGSGFGGGGFSGGGFGGGGGGSW